MNILRPWSVSTEGVMGTVDDNRFIILDAQGNHIGIINKESDAAFIVSAVNTSTIKGE